MGIGDSQPNVRKKDIGDPWNIVTSSPKFFILLKIDADIHFGNV